MGRDSGGGWKKKICACLCWVEESLCGRACNAFGEESTSISARSLGLRRIKGFVCLHNKMHNFGKKNGERWDSTGRYEMGKLMRRRRVYVSHSLTFLICAAQMGKSFFSFSYFPPKILRCLSVYVVLCSRYTQFYMISSSRLVQTLENRTIFILFFLDLWISK